MALDSKSYRNLMGTFATGITVITTDNGGMLHGITANGVTSVSLDPMLFLACIGKDAHAHVEIHEAGAFGVSILGASQMDVSNAFAKSGPPEEGSLRGQAFRKGETGVPLLEGAIACLECKVTAELEGGDHTIFVGEVAAGEILSEEAPLIYFSGGYRELA